MFRRATPGIDVRRIGGTSEEGITARNSDFGVIVVLQGLVVVGVVIRQVVIRPVVRQVVIRQVVIRQVESQLHPTIDFADSTQSAAWAAEYLYAPRRRNGIFSLVPAALS